jgi:hypothetical protein
VASGSAQGVVEALGEALGEALPDADADGELVLAGAEAPEDAEAVGLGVADELTPLVIPILNGLNTSTVSKVGSCRNITELMATEP